MNRNNILSLCLLAAFLAACLCGCRPGSHPIAPTDASTEGSVSLDQNSGATEESTLPSQDTTEATPEATAPSESTGPSVETTEPSVETTEPSVETTGPSAGPTPSNFSLAGVWATVRRSGDELWVSYLEFLEDGTGFAYGCDYYNINTRPFPDMETDEGGWYVAPMGYPYEYFNYTLENGVLTLSYTGGDYEVYDPPIVRTYSLQILGDDLICLDDSYGKYTREDLSLKELCALMGVNYEPSSSSARLLVGRWQTVSRNADDCLTVHSWSFSETGIASPYFTFYDHSSKKVPGIIYGEPNEDGWCEGWDESDDQVYTYSLDNDVLTLVFSWGEHMEPEDVGLTKTFHLEWVDDNTIRLTSDGESTIFVRSDDLSIKELCAQMGVDYSAP